MSSSSQLPGFRNLSPSERVDFVSRHLGLAEEDTALLRDSGALPIDIADGMIENVLGKFELPLGLAGNFMVNGRDVLIPMAVEEPSVVAAASFMAKLARPAGGFLTSSSAPLMRAQIQIVGLADPANARLSLLRNKARLIELANTKDQLLNKLGGGCRDLEVHTFLDSRGAHGGGPPGGGRARRHGRQHGQYHGRGGGAADRGNHRRHGAAAHSVQPGGPAAGARPGARRPEHFETDAFSGTDVIDRIIDAYTFAAIDPYRAATHNKGIMNGIDPLIVATGNDWRAVEAGAHAYACRDGHYGSLTTWEKDREGHLVGTIEMPMPVGLVGGATKTHPLARLALKILGVKTSQELAEIAVAVGLAQNLGALRALATEGIQRGHMALHARNIALSAGARGAEVDQLVRQMVQDHDVRSDRAEALLKALREQ